MPGAVASPVELASSPDSRPVSDSAAAPIWIGTLCVLLFFGGFGGWAATAPLNGAIVADGVVMVEGNRKSVQHLEGGIVKEIRVKDGDIVQAGDILIQLDDTAARAQYDIYFQQLALARAMEARLTAELGKSDAIEFPQDLLNSRDRFVQKAIESQTAEFAMRREALFGAGQVLGRRIDQLNEQIAGNKASLLAHQEQLASVLAEKSSLQGLLKSGLTTRARILDLERDASALQGQIGDANATNAVDYQHMEEIKQQIEQLTNDKQSEVSQALAEIQSKILDIAPRLQNARAQLDRTTIRSPSEGKIVGLAAHTVGAVVAPGAIILDVVPERTSLVIQARIHVEDISDLRPGMKAEIRFISYKQRTTPLIDASVRQVSADRLTDERTLAAYYLAEVEVNATVLAANPEIVLYPGMPATVLVTTQERTALDYFLGPLVTSFDHAFKQK